MRVTHIVAFALPLLVLLPTGCVSPEPSSNAHADVERNKRIDSQSTLNLMNWARKLREALVRIGPELLTDDNWHDHWHQVLSLLRLQFRFHDQVLYALRIYPSVGTRQLSEEALRNILKEVRNQVSSKHSEPELQYASQIAESSLSVMWQALKYHAGKHYYFSLRDSEGDELKKARVWYPGDSVVIAYIGQRVNQNGTPDAPRLPLPAYHIMVTPVHVQQVADSPAATGSEYVARSLLRLTAKGVDSKLFTHVTDIMHAVNDERANNVYAIAVSSAQDSGALQDLGVQQSKLNPVARSWLEDINTVTPGFGDKKFAQKASQQLKRAYKKQPYILRVGVNPSVQTYDGDLYAEGEFPYNGDIPYIPRECSPDSNDMRVLKNSDRLPYLHALITWMCMQTRFANDPNTKLLEAVLSKDSITVQTEGPEEFRSVPVERGI